MSGNSAVDEILQTSCRLAGVVVNVAGTHLAEGFNELGNTFTVHPSLIHHSVAKVPVAIDDGDNVVAF